MQKVEGEILRWTMDSLPPAAASRAAGSITSEPSTMLKEIASLPEGTLAGGPADRKLKVVL